MFQSHKMDLKLEYPVFLKLALVKYGNIWSKKSKKQLSVEKPIVQGYNFFKSAKVLGL